MDLNIFIAELIPVIIIVMLVLFPRETVLNSSSILGKFIAVSIIAFYSQYNALYGLVICLLVIWYYQSDFLERRVLAEGMDNMGSDKSDMPSMPGPSSGSSTSMSMPGPSGTSPSSSSMPTPGSGAGPGPSSTKMPTPSAKMDGPTASAPSIPTPGGPASSPPLNTQVSKDTTTKDTTKDTNTKDTAVPTTPSPKGGIPTVPSPGVGTSSSSSSSSSTSSDTKKVPSPGSESDSLSSSIVTSTAGEETMTNYSDAYPDKVSPIPKASDAIFRQQHCSPELELLYKNVPVRHNEMITQLYPELSFDNDKSCNPCDPSCRFSIMDNKINTERNILASKGTRGKEGLSVLEWAKSWFVNKSEPFDGIKTSVASYFQ